MGNRIKKFLHLPSKDRSYWKAVDGSSTLLYLAWGRRDFGREPISLSRHEGWITGLIQEGNPTLVLKEKHITLTRNQLFLLGPDCASGWIASDECKLILFMWKSLSPTLLMDNNTNSYKILSTTREERSAFENLHIMCRQEVACSETHHSEYLSAIRTILEITIGRSISTLEYHQENQHLYEQALIWMEGHLDSKKPIARVCDYLAISESSLYRIFRRNAGQSPLVSFRRMKMEKAKKLLQETDLLAKEVAFQMGYNHFSDFSRAFKNYHGMPATAFRHSD